MLITNRARLGASVTRRHFTAGVLATAGAAATAHAFADLQRTPESAMGPFYPVDRLADADADLTRVAGRTGRASGTIIEVTGRVLDRKGNPVSGAKLELWQANSAGRYLHANDPAIAPIDPEFQGFAALETDAKGQWRIVTVKPGGYDSPIGHRPPHIHFIAQGRRDRNVLQLYFPEDAEANAADRLYRELGPDAASSVAVRSSSDANTYSWDIILAEG